MRLPVVLGIAGVMTIGVAAAPAAQRRSSAPIAAPAKKSVTDFTCASEVGTGSKTRRRFCDLLVAATPAESVSITIPPHVGTATLTFDLHNRFDLPNRMLTPIVFANHAASVAVIKPTGDVIDRAAVTAEFRSASTDTFDRIDAGGVDGGTKAVAPGPAQPIRVTIPAGVNAVGIVGVKLWATGANGQTEVVDTAGRPVAIVSNVKVEYTPR